MKRTDIRFTVAAKLLFICWCVLTGVAGALESVTHRCPNPNSLTHKDDPDHYFSPPSSNNADKAPNQCNSCQDPDNTGNKACGVYAFLHSDACRGQSSCRNHYASFNIYRDKSLRYALAHMSSASKPCHFVVFALDPVIGIDDANHRGHPNFWNHAYYASQKLMTPQIAPGELGLAINPATRRGQHQLHIHVGKVTASYRHAIDQLKKVTGFRSVKINGIDYRVAYVPDQAGPFAGLSPFETVANVYGEDFMPREGILVARSKDSKGWFVLAALDKWVENQLDYSSPQCSMALPRLPSSVLPD